MYQIAAGIYIVLQRVSNDQFNDLSSRLFKPLFFSKSQSTSIENCANDHLEYQISSLPLNSKYVAIFFQFRMG